MSKTDVIQQIYEVAADCAKPDWDGYGAAPVADASAMVAVALVLAMPDGVPLPEPTPEKDGEMALDWFTGKDAYLSVSANVNRRLPYAWHCGSERGYGVAEFDAEFPPELLAIIERVYAKEDSK